MDAALYAKIISDKYITDLKKLKFKYPQADIQELVELLKANVYQELPLPDYNGKNLV